MVARGHDAAAGQPRLFHLKAGDIISLPAVHRDRNRESALDGFVGVNAERGVLFAGVRVWFAHGFLSCICVQVRSFAEKLLIKTARINSAPLAVA